MRTFSSSSSFAGFGDARARRSRGVTERVTIGQASSNASLHDGVIFCFDLEMPEDVEPRNTDGEVESFALRPAEEVLRLLRETEEFVYDVALVNLDALIRHGMLTPEREPDYLEILSGLRVAEGA